MRMEWRGPLVTGMATVTIGVLLVAVFFDGLVRMAAAWEQAEYSYGYFIPALAAYLVWERRRELAWLRRSGSWTALAIVALGLALFALGELGTLYVVIQYAFLTTLFGVVLAGIGWPAMRVILAPLALLIFMVPLPVFLYNGLSGELQLISSKLGVWFIRLFGISVFLDGNIIDLGSFKLQVVEACSGLRYLFPMLALAYIVVCFFKAPLWKRAVLFVSSVPITIVMNSLRIAAVAVTVEYWGPVMAEGLLHDFEGWAVFMASLGMLLLELWVLARIGGPARTMRPAGGAQRQTGTSAGQASGWSWKRPLPAAIALLTLAALVAPQLDAREEFPPARKSFAEFPALLGEWRGTKGQLEEMYVAALDLDDYMLADFVRDDLGAVNLYVAYYESQRKGAAAHSPRSCIPGDGWTIMGLNEKVVTDVLVDGVPLAVNRVEIRKGKHTQLVYYWFQQRGRNLTNEYLVKWYLFWDAVTKRRTDGALVRLSSVILPGEKIEDAERRLEAFTRAIAGSLHGYIPD